MEKPILKHTILTFLLGGLLMYAISFREASIPDTAFIPEARAAESPEDSLVSLLEVQSAFRLVSAQLNASVVEIKVESEKLLMEDNPEELPWNDFFKDPSKEPEGLQFYRSMGMGSGVIIHRDKDTYFIVTNSHVIGHAETINVKLYSGESISGQLVGKDDRRDLALIRITSSEKTLPTAEFGDSDTLYVGDLVLAIGNPYGYGNSVTAGIVSAMDRRYGPQGNINAFIQTDAAINQGNSGGPLINIHGEVIGINTFITTPNSGSIGLGFAIPANNVQSYVRRLLENGVVRYGWLGASLGIYSHEVAESLGHPPDHGVMVYQVFLGSPADEAGLQAGDLILSMDDERFTNYEALIYEIGEVTPGDTVVFSIDRFGHKLELHSIIGERLGEDEILAMYKFAWPGFVPAPMNDEIRDLMGLPHHFNGIPVAVVYPRSPAHTFDLREGDIITFINDVLIDSIPALYTALGKVEPDLLTITVFRKGESITLTIPEGR